jgi:hypothetical protein
MSLFRAFMAAIVFSALPLALGYAGAGALGQLMHPASEQQLLLDAVFECGMFDGGFKCRPSSGAKSFGKNATPGAPARSETAPEAIPGGEQALPNPSIPGAGDAGQTTSSGAPPACPANSELLGGHCIAFRQTCRSGLAASANPPICQGAEEKQVCSIRPDGLKDCCCRTYSKF